MGSDMSISRSGGFGVIGFLRPRLCALEADILFSMIGLSLAVVLKGED
jgi:hypothetical protein